MSEKDILPEGTGPAKPAFWRVLDSAPSAVLAASDTGACIYANQAAVAYLGYDTGELTRLHLSDLEAVDAQALQLRLASLRLHRAWSGRVSLRHKEGGVIPAAVNAFTGKLPEGQDAFIEIVHPVVEEPRRRGDSSPDNPPGMEGHALQVLMLCSEGFTVEDIAVLLGIGPDEVVLHIQAARRQMNTSSTTEACVRALKAGLIV